MSDESNHEKAKMLSTTSNNVCSRRNGEIKEEQKKVVVSYMECLKNHAAAIGGISTDGCGEFMPAGNLGTIEALKCSACSCHRNFHRKNIQSSVDDHSSSPIFFLKHNNNNNNNNAYGKKPINWWHHQNAVILDSSQHVWHPTNSLFGISYKSKSGDGDGDDGDDGDDEAHEKVVMRKRFRTKFSVQQKEKMLEFAEKAEWKIHKVEDSVVQQFCRELGIKRRVLKVWIHNNKRSFANKTQH